MAKFYGFREFHKEKASLCVLMYQYQPSKVFSADGVKTTIW